ncbi:MAG: hypothetical protein ACFFE8_00565 [Candidatus Heimdallarchaeota archaeon]
MHSSVRLVKKRLQLSQKKWNQIQNHSLRTVNSILTVLSRLNMIQARPEVFSELLLKEFVDIPDRLAYRLADIINKNLADLNRYLSQFSDVLKEMRKIETQFRLDFSELAKKKVLGENPVGGEHDLEVIEQAELTIQKIVDMYETELSLRQAIIAEIQDMTALQPAHITAYLVLWSSEIYIEPNKIVELIEEFTHVEKIYRQSYDSLPKSR